ncbi:MAG: RDD family protein [Verrucomicrobiota bacterium]
MTSYWVRGDDGEEYGPCSREELREWIGENRLGLDSMVRADGPGAEWEPLQTIPELVVLIAEDEVKRQRPDIVGGQPLAGYGRRALATLIDLLLIYIIATLILIPIIWLTQIDLNQFMTEFMEWARGERSDPPASLFAVQLTVQIVYILVVLGYMGFFVGRDGQTPGMLAFRLRVVDGEGLTVSTGRSLLRASCFYLSVYFYGLGFVVAFFTARRQTLHDLAAGTFVIQLPKRE